MTYQRHEYDPEQDPRSVLRDLAEKVSDYGRTDMDDTAEDESNAMFAAQRAADRYLHETKGTP